MDYRTYTIVLYILITIKILIYNFKLYVNYVKNFLKKIINFLMFFSFLKLKNLKIIKYI